MFKLNGCKTLIALAITATVAACGGGGSSGAAGPGAPGAPGAPLAAAPATCAIPASAVASVGGLIAFLNQLIDTATNEISEPIALCDVTLPVDDTV